jgi:tripartite-type tricarboxylate transporter receptor subunit TctC
MTRSKPDPTRRGLLAAAGALPLAVALAPREAVAQVFPARQIRVIVPYAAGGTSDILARTLGVRVGEALGQQIVVENRPGANGALGSDLVAKAPADGYTLLLTDVGGLTSAPAVVPNLPFDPVKDFAPVTMIAWSPHLLVVTPSLAARNLGELVAVARAKPGVLNCATVGAGSAPHLAGALFARRAGIDWAFVPYKGGAQALNDLAGGQAEVMFNGMLATLPFVSGNKLRAVAISSDRRWPTLPDLPTVAEQGFPGFMTGSWQGLLAPAGTPAPVLARLQSEFARALSAPEASQRLTAQGAEPRPMASSEFGEFLRSETSKWAQLVKETGIKAE